MTRIRATCPTCGEVELQPHEIELHIVGADTDDVRDGSCYLFDCPTCAEEITKPADERIARLLTSGGVPVTCLGGGDLEGELRAILTGAMAALEHPEGVVDGPPLTADDLLDFHQLLATEDWFERLSQTC